MLPLSVVLVMTGVLLDSTKPTQSGIHQKHVLLVVAAIYWRSQFILNNMIENRTSV